jgi:hypothetical protein
MEADMAERLNIAREAMRSLRIRYTVRKRFVIGFANTRSKP